MLSRLLPVAYCHGRAAASDGVPTQFPLDVETSKAASVNNANLLGPTRPSIEPHASTKPLQRQTQGRIHRFTAADFDPKCSSFVVSWEFPWSRFGG